ncbi:MAG TPA: glycosyltransferase family 9 protein [Longimicrobium sp.]
MPDAPPRLGRVCIVMMSALGDAVHVLPVVNALRRHDPAARLTWVLQPGPASLVRGHPAVDEIVVFERAKGWRGFAEVGRALRARRFDLLVDLQVYFKASVVTALARAPVKLGFDRARARDWNWLVTNRKIPPHAPQHVQEQYFEFLHALGVDPEPVEWNLGPWPHERARQRELFATIPRPAALLVIGSSHPEKEWLPERWAALADALAERYGLTSVLAGGRSPRELETEREIVRLARHPVVSTLGAPLRDLVALIDGSALVVSLDTGPMHMAVAMDVPTVALMGFNNPKRVGPWRRFHDLLVDAYGDPGEDYPVSMQKRPGRMRRITVDDVLERVERWRERYADRRPGPGAS